MNQIGDREEATDDKNARRLGRAWVRGLNRGLAVRHYSVNARRHAASFTSNEAAAWAGLVDGRSR